MNTTRSFLIHGSQFFGTIAKHLKSEGIVDGARLWALDRFQNLSVQIWKLQVSSTRNWRNLDKEQIFRIDHYLEKNDPKYSFAIRFGNLIFNLLETEILLTISKFTLLNRLGVEERVATYWLPRGSSIWANHILAFVSACHGWTTTKIWSMSK